MRDQAWLQQLLDETWDAHFSDIPQYNDVRIVFGRRAKRRLGSIQLDPADHKTSIITMNGLFRDPAIPEMVVKATLVHELSHYAHGFNSPLEQAYDKPHAGGVMRREYAERGLLNLYLEQKGWLKANWPLVIAKEFPARSQQRRIMRARVPKPFWFLGE